MDDNYEKNYLSKRPDDLCLKCGLCCRLATTTIPYVQLKQMSDDGIQGAVDFLSIFEPYPSIEAAKEVCSETVEHVMRCIKERYYNGEVTFYKCKYLGDDNLCTRYDNRLLLCKHFPASPWAVVPPGCGYEGWLFMKREETKQKVRKVKEDMLELELLKTKTKSPDIQLKIASVLKKMHATIDVYKRHGAENW